jgi:hypothetical protein
MSNFSIACSRVFSSAQSTGLIDPGKMAAGL